MLQHDVGGAASSSELSDEACSMKSVNSSVMSLFACSDSSLLAELVSRDARGDASGQVCGILVMPSASSGVLVGYLDFDLLKAALMPETMTEPHLGPMWDRSVKVWIAKVIEGNRWGR